MPGIDFVALRRQIRLAQVLDLVHFQAVSGQGAQVRGPCPVHGSTRPRSRVFAARLDKQMWHCFRCGASGNALDLWLAVTKQPVYAGALELCRRLGLEVPWLPRRGGPWCPRTPARSPPRL
ncbi:MAG TPA: CHC2 zinc finger domain-containing protein [Gemmataceae bacterium]|jgi:DNA primase|nr:CHC2 zinc finger domain-containing protein [Gemmataceae bacterium]